jgi:hypothetical protein
MDGPEVTPVEIKGYQWPLGTSLSRAPSILILCRLSGRRRLLDRLAARLKLMDAGATNGAVGVRGVCIARRSRVSLCK